MFYSIDQLRTPSFLSGLVNTKSDVIVRLVETDLGKWTLVVVVAIYQKNVNQVTLNRTNL